MKRKIHVLIVCAMLFAECRSVDAQQPRKIFRIGFLEGSTASDMAILVDAFRQELRQVEMD